MQQDIPSGESSPLLLRTLVNSNNSDPTTAKRVLKADNSFLSNIYYVTPCAVLVCILGASLFYKYYHGWDYSTCLYYATQALVGEMYGIPEENDPLSEAFTLLIFIIGTTCVAVAIGAYASMVAEHAVYRARKRVRMTAVEDLNHDGVISLDEWCVYYWSRFLDVIGWDDHKFKYFTVAGTGVWLLVGIAFSRIYEGQSYFQAVYFAVGAMSCSGYPAPECSSPGNPSNCTIDFLRAVFVSVYIMVGVPLFSLSMGQFSGIIIERAEHASELAKISRPITDEEFLLAACVTGAVGNPAKVPSSYGTGGSRDINELSLDLSQFIVMELLRLQRVSEDELNDFKDIFSSIDMDSSGTIDYSEVKLYQKRFLEETSYKYNFRV
mmetsp:Transcript_14833/g.22324  ORF Transcript_14833/g.22324 Transcript_14833/m.22324 type:complete len:380 (+) Transcript_14833:68-1207(+)